MNIQSINYSYFPKCSVSFGHTTQNVQNNNDTAENLPPSYKRVEFFRRRYFCAKQSIDEARYQRDKEYFANRCHQDAQNIVAACKEAYKDHTGLDLIRISQVYDKYELNEDQAKIAKKYYPELFVDYDDMQTAGMDHIVVRANGTLGSSSSCSTR